MKKTILFLGLALVMSAFTGCSKDEATNAGGETVGKALPNLTAEMPEVNSDTRIYLKEGVVVWKLNDAVALFNEGSAGAKVRYNLVAGADTRQGTFVAEGTDALKPVPYGKLEDGSNDLRYVVVAPYAQLAADFVPNMYRKLGATIPTVQNYREGTFDGAVMPMMAVVQMVDGEFTPMKFKYISSLLHFPLKASEATTLSKVILSTSGENDALAGDIYYEFTEQSASKYGSNAKRDQIFLDMAYPMDYKQGNFWKNSNEITLKGNIALDATTAKDIYFGVLPGGGFTNESGQFFPFSYTLTFCREDGVKFEKSISTKRTELLPGDVGNLPELTLEVPYMPVITEGKVKVDGVDVEAYMWKPNATLVSQQLIEISDEDGEVLRTIGLSPTDTFVTKAAVLNALAYVNLTPGEELTLGVAVKATFKDVKGAAINAVSSAPLELLYTSPTPMPNWSIAEVYDGFRVMFDTDNFNVYETVEYAYKAGDKLTVEDFNDASFKTMESRFVIIPFADISYGSTTVMVKVTCGMDTKTSLKSFVYEAPAAPAEKVTFELKDKCLIFFENYNALTQYQPFAVSEVTLYWAEGTNQTTFTHSQKMTSEEFWLDSDPDDGYFSSDEHWTPHTFKIVVKGTFSNGKTEISATINGTPEAW